MQGSLLKGNSREHVPVQTDGQDHPPGAPAQLSSRTAAAPQPPPSKAKVPQAKSLSWKESTHHAPAVTVNRCGSSSAPESVSRGQTAPAG